MTEATSFGSGATSPFRAGSPTPSEMDQVLHGLPNPQSTSSGAFLGATLTAEEFARVQNLVNAGLLTLTPKTMNTGEQAPTEQNLFTPPPTPPKIPETRKRTLQNEPTSSPKRASKPKGGTKNKSIPVKMSCFPIYQSNDPEHKLPPHALRHEIQDGYLIIEKLHNMPLPFEKQWRWDNSKNCWWMLIKSEKMYHMIGEYIAKCCSLQGLQFEDRRDGFKNTSVMCNIEVFISDAPDAEGKEEEWLCVSGETFFVREVCKDFGGRWDFGSKAWDAVSKDALQKIVEEAWLRGFPLSGNFNHDGSMTQFLGTHGAFIEQAGSEYKWTIVKGQAPAVMPVAESSGQE